MKFCKDCKHVALPHPMASLVYGYNIVNPMCGHPDAERDIVYGNYAVSCVEARGIGCNFTSGRNICGASAKLFEPRPEPVPDQFKVVEYNVEPDIRVGFSQRISDWVMG